MTNSTEYQSPPAPLAEQKRSKKLLIVAHNHPHFHPGGGEIVAYDLFKAIRDNTEYSEYQPFFLAAAPTVSHPLHEGTPFQVLLDKPDETLFWGNAYDYFYHSQQNLKFIYSDFKDFLKDFQPDVIHFHHIIRIGLEAIQMARKVLPDVKIVYTIHEYLLMCYRDGQMLRKHNNELCEYASPNRCHQCFPELSPQQFKMRETFIKAHLDLVDRFISPSHFLANRFIAWGIPPAKMTVMENGRTITEMTPHRHLEEGGKRNIFGYFGQINPYKGVILLLEAAQFLVNNDFDDFHLNIFGSIGWADSNFQDKFFELLDNLKNHVTYYGRYKQEEFQDLIEPIDWVIMPSIWWENSPLVIQEVFLHKRPIICSNIGGMAEKVENNVTGLHFNVNNVMSLATTIKQASMDLQLWQTLVSNIQPRLSIEESAEAHVKLYNSLI